MLGGDGLLGSFIGLDDCAGLDVYHVCYCYHHYNMLYAFIFLLSRIRSVYPCI